MIWATEMSGVLNRALAGLARVISRGWRFDPPETAQEAKEEWLIEANPLPAFIDARCEPKGTCWLLDLYATTSSSLGPKAWDHPPAAKIHV